MPDPRDERALAKRDADDAVKFFTRLVARGLSRREALDLTAAWVMRNVAEREEEKREPWE